MASSRDLVLSKIMNILVIGDSCKDVFVYCAVDRFCPEVPVPILKVRESVENGGMSKNVQRNILSLKVNCDLHTNPNWEKMTKSRYVHRESNHMFLRIDADDIADHINLNVVKYNYDAIIISDYNKGFLTEKDIETICLNHSRVFLDTKKILGSWAEKAHFIKINHTEFTNSRPFMNETLLKKTIHTMGSEGAELYGKLYPVNPVEVKDASGAGDTFMAGLVVKYLETNNIDQSIMFANQCAREVVQHRGVVSI